MQEVRHAREHEPHDGDRSRRARRRALLTAGCARAESEIPADQLATATPPRSRRSSRHRRSKASGRGWCAGTAPSKRCFVHPLILRPKLAFRGGQARGFLDYFITAREFRALLDELWRNGWTLVDVHKAAAGTVRVPQGRTPLVLYEDDANYYRYFRGEGLARRLVVDPSGEVRASFPAEH